MARALVCLRYFLIAGAIVIGVCGIIESVCAGYFIYQLYEYSNLSPSNVCGSSITMFALGLVTCLLAWCAWQFLDFTNGAQVIIFSVALLIISLLNTSAGIWTLLRHEQVDTLPTEYLERVFQLALTDDKPLWDSMHTKLRCCGINGPTDYRSQKSIPWSCCDTSTLGSSSENKGVCTTMYGRGCQHVIINRTRSILLHVFLLALCTVLLQVCFVTCMFCYARACRERDERRKELMIATQTLTRASKEFETNDSLLSRQSKYYKGSTDL